MKIQGAKKSHQSGFSSRPGAIFTALYMPVGLSFVPLNSMLPLNVFLPSGSASPTQLHFPRLPG